MESVFAPTHDGKCQIQLGGGIPHEVKAAATGHGDTGAAVLAAATPGSPAAFGIQAISGASAGAGVPTIAGIDDARWPRH
jgi:hypothetical protein